MITIHAVILDGTIGLVHPQTTYRSISEAFKDQEYAYAAFRFERKSVSWQIMRGVVGAGIISLALVGLFTTCRMPLL